MVPEAGLEPARTKSPRDFKSLVSTNSTTPANILLEATPGFEPGMRILQTLALPLGDVAKKMERETGLEPATSTLARLRSTTELFPPFGCANFKFWVFLSNCFFLIPRKNFSCKNMDFCTL